MRFIHAVNPASKNAGYACLNLANLGRLWSPDYLVSRDPALQTGHVRLSTFPIEVLAQAPFPTGALSPAASYLLIAANVNSGVTLSYGDGRELPEELIEYSKKRATKELEFEAVRRLVSWEAPSRLSCLWLAEDTADGREMLCTIFRTQSLHFLTVEIEDTVAMHRGDWKYWESFWNESNSGFASGYWRGEPNGDQPYWEYLLDGAIKCIDQLEIARLCRAHLESECGPWGSENPPPDALLRAAALA